MSNVHRIFLPLSSQILFYRMWHIKTRPGKKTQSTISMITMRVQLLCVGRYVLHKIKICILPIGGDGVLCLTCSGLALFSAGWAWAVSLCFPSSRIRSWLDWCSWLGWRKDLCLNSIANTSSLSVPPGDIGWLAASWLAEPLGGVAGQAACWLAEPRGGVAMPSFRAFSLGEGSDSECCLRNSSILCSLRTLPRANVFCISGDVRACGEDSEPWHSSAKEGGVRELSVGLWFRLGWPAWASRTVGLE